MRGLLLVLVLLLFLIAPLRSQDMGPFFPDDPPPAQTEPTPEPPKIDIEQLRTTRIRLALEYLAAKQVTYQDTHGQTAGYWANGVGYKRGSTYQVTKPNGRHPGITSIVCLAFMANGYLPGRGKYGDVLVRALRFIVECTEVEGAIPGYVSRDGSRMYSHAFGALFLAEILGMANVDSELEDRLRRATRNAIALIVQSQNKNGGWRYSPFQEASDISVVVCQLQALRAAASVGIRVPERTIQAARAYVAHCYMPNGEFRYEMEDPTSRRTWTLTAAGMVALQQTGVYNSFINDKSQRVFFDDTIIQLLGLHDHDVFDQTFVPNFDYYYGHYYAVQALYQVGRTKPNVWEKYRREAFPIILDRFDEENNRWADQIGYNYATGMAVLILSMENEYLPIFQK